MNFTERIEACYPKMTKKQKQIADYMRNNIETMCFVTLKEMSTELGITEITILNTCKILEYSSFNEMKYEARKYINKNRRSTIYQENEYYHTTVPQRELSDKEKLLREICIEERQQMEEFCQLFEPERYLAVAELFFQYSKIYICGRGASRLLAERLSSGLSLSQCASCVVNTELNEDIYATLPAIDRNTLLVTIAFPDYYFVTEQIAEYGRKAGAKVLVITDNQNTRIAKAADELLLAPCTTRLSINTMSTPMALITLLTSAVKTVDEDKVNKNKKNIGEQFSSLFKN